MSTKVVLPHPYNLDLSPVLHGLARRTAIGRRRLANDPVTAAYLAAGMRLLERQIGQTSCDRTAEGGDEIPNRPLLRLLSQRAVVDEMTKNESPFLKAGSTSTLRSTWWSQPHYVADLLRFGLWSEHYYGLYSEELARYAEGLIGGANFAEAIEFITSAHLEDNIHRPRFRLQLLSAAMAEGDELIRQAVRDNYRAVEQTWQPIFAEALRSRGLRLRPGFTIDDFSSLVVAVVEGLSLRALTNTELASGNRTQQESLATLAVMMLILGCSERAESGDDRSIDEVFRCFIEPTG